MGTPRFSINWEEVKSAIKSWLLVVLGGAVTYLPFLYEQLPEPAKSCANYVISGGGLLYFIGAVGIILIILFGKQFLSDNSKK